MATGFGRTFSLPSGSSHESFQTYLSQKVLFNSNFLFLKKKNLPNILSVSESRGFTPS
jgi:hypothetical protein